MQFKEYGFGLYGWQDKDIIIAGGMRDHGYHPPGQMRATFVAYDAAKAIKEGKQQPDEIGNLTLVVNLGDGNDVLPSIDKLIKIEIKKELRRQGLGRRVVEAVMRAAPRDVEICDIKRNAKGFWIKMGAEGFRASGKNINAVMAKSPEQLPTDNVVETAGPKV